MAVRKVDSAPDRNHEHGSKMADLDQPFFLIGAARSGTTLTRLILGHHPRIAPCDEFDYAVEFAIGKTDWPPIEAYHEWLAERWTFRVTSRTIDPELEYPELVRSFLSQSLESERQTHVGAVVHRGYDQLLRLWPHAKIIHLVRDPRDVASSRLKMGWEGNVWLGVNQWIESETLWDDLRSTLKPDQYCELRFEHLLAEPEREARRLCAFLGVEYDPIMLEIDRDTTYARPRPGIAAAWKDRLSSRDVRRVEAKLGSLLTARGYAMSGLAPLRVSFPERTWLYVHHRLKRFAFRVKRYGFWLSLSYSIRRLLPLSSWRRHVSRKYDEITIRQLK